MSRFTQLVARVLGDPIAEEVRRNHERCIRELQQAPAAAAVLVEGVSLQSGVATSIPHTLGRAPRMITVSPVRGAAASGRIEETRNGVDRSKAIILTATGFGATITVDVEVK